MPDAKVRITSEYDGKGAKQAQTGIKGIGDSAKKAKGGLSAFGDTAKGVMAGMIGFQAIVKLFGTIKKFFSDSLAAFGKQEDAVNALNKSLENQGQYTKEVSKDLQAYASELQKTSVYGDEVIVGVMTSINAFGLQSKEMKMLTQATLDLAQASGMDLKAAGDLVAKSVGSTTNALSRYGIAIDVNKSKEEKALEITKQVAKLYGGQAQTATKSFEGQTKQLANAFGDFQEKVGKLIADGLKPLLPALNNVIETFSKTIDEVEIGVGWFNSLTSAIKKTIEQSKPQEKAFSLIGGAIDKYIIKKYQYADKEFRDFLTTFARGLRSWADDVNGVGIIVSQGEKKQGEKRIAIAKEVTEAKLKELEKEKKANKALADDMAKAFMESATTAQFSWETTMQKITTATISNGITPMVKGMKDGMGVFGEFSSILLTGVGGAIGGVVGGFLNMLGGQSKSTAEYTQEAYDRMVNKTTKKLDEIGKEKTEISRAATLIEELSSTMATGEKFKTSSEATAIKDITGINIAGLTKGQALQKLSTATSILPSEFDVKKADIESTKQFFIGEVNKSGMSGALKASYINKIKNDSLTRTDLDVLAFTGGGNVGQRQGEYAGRLNVMQQYQTEIGVAQLEALNETLRLINEANAVLKEEAAVVPSAQTGGYVKSSGLVNVHAGETITPNGKEGSKGGNNYNFAFTVNGVNWSNENQKKAIAKQLSAYIMKYVNGEVTLPYGTERRL